MTTLGLDSCCPREGMMLHEQETHSCAERGAFQKRCSVSSLSDSGQERRVRVADALWSGRERELRGDK